MKQLAICVLVVSYLGSGFQASAQVGIISTVAGSASSGSGTGGFSGDGGPATSASLWNPAGIAVDASGNLFIADTGNSRIRKVSAGGIVTTVAGNGSYGFSGDGGPAISASLWSPAGIAVDASGNLFIADTYNNRVRKVSASGIITTVAGSGIPLTAGNVGFSGDGGPAISARLNSPYGVAVDASGNLFIADTYNNRIRKVSTTGMITTVAGSGGFGGYNSGGYAGDGGPAASALLNQPYGVAVDTSGNLFIADNLNCRIRKVSASGMISTVAGGLTYGFSGDGGPAASALLRPPWGVAVDVSGNLFIADTLNYRIRKVSASGIIATVAGTGGVGSDGGGFSGDGGPATSALLFDPSGVAVDASGNLFIADSFNNRIREVPLVNALGGIQNAASYATGAVSPGEIVILYGAGLGPAALAGAQIDGNSGLLQTTVAGTAVWFNGIPAPIVYTSANQVAAVVPYGTADSSTARILVNYRGDNVAASTVTIAPSAPGIFTTGPGTGQAAALNPDGSVNSASNPAAAGSIIVLFLTGEGQTAPPGVDGRIAAAAPLPAPVLPVTVSIGGQPAALVYAGAAPDEVAGVMQVNARIPAGVTGDAVPVSVRIGSASARDGATIAVQ